MILYPDSHKAAKAQRPEEEEYGTRRLLTVGSDSFDAVFDELDTEVDQIAELLLC